MASNKRQVLYIAPADPWDRWTNSGTPMMLMRGLSERGLLYGALSRDSKDLKELHGRDQLRHFLFKVRRKLLKPAPKTLKDFGPMDEREGILAKILPRLPENTVVFYHYALPIIDKNLPIKRFLFQDITFDDMQKAAGFGITVLNDAEIARRRAETEAILKQVDGICSFATFVAHAMKAQHGISPSKVFPIGAGAIREVHGEVPTNIERYKKRRILFVGRQWERKGGPILLEAFKRVRKELPDATLTVVSSLAQFEPQEGVEHIKFASNEELHELYKACSVFTMPSICETWGLVYVEAAMHGLPTANWDNWALPDIVDHGQSGVLTSKHNAEGLAEALIEALRDPVRLQGMGKASISRVKDVLAWPWVYERLLSAIMPEELQGKEPKWMRPRPLV